MYAPVFVVLGSREQRRNKPYRRISLRNDSGSMQWSTSGCWTWWQSKASRSGCTCSSRTVFPLTKHWNFKTLSATTYVLLFWIPSTTATQGLAEGRYLECDNEHPVLHIKFTLLVIVLGVSNTIMSCRFTFYRQSWG